MTTDQSISLIFACLLVYTLFAFLTFGYWDERRKGFKYGSEEYDNGPFHPVLSLVWPLLWIKGAIKFSLFILKELGKELFLPSSWR
jgi:hypothetical protein